MTDRERAWRTIKDVREFTITDLVEAVGISRSNAQHMCRLLEKRDLLEGWMATGKGSTNALEKHYRLVRVPASDRPWDEDPALTSWRQQVWNAIRMRKRFTVADLATALSDDADVTSASVHRYVKALAEEDAVHRVGRTVSEAGGQPIIYALSIRPGPRPPDVRAAGSRLRRNACNNNTASTDANRKA